MDLGRAPQAIAAYEGALARGAENHPPSGTWPSSTNPWVDTPKPAWAFERVTQLDPTSVAVWWNLGVFRTKEGRLGDAEAAFQQAQRLDPGNLAIRKRLEEIRARTGR